jgi:hypothetical protein
MAAITFKKSALVRAVLTAASSGGESYSSSDEGVSMNDKAILGTFVVFTVFIVWFLIKMTPA